MSEQWINKKGVKQPVYDNPGDFPADCMKDYQSPEERIVWRMGIKAKPQTRTTRERIVFDSEKAATALRGAYLSLHPDGFYILSDPCTQPLADALREAKIDGMVVVQLLGESENVLEEWPIA